MMQHYRCGFNADEVSRAVGFDCHQRMSDLHRDGYLRDTGVTRAPEEVAAAAVFLASDELSYFTGRSLSPNSGLFIN